MASVQSMQPETQAARMPLAPTPDSSGQKRKLVDLRAPGHNEEDHSPEDQPSDPAQSGDSMEISESKRRAQNRAAQRAFRERKERYLRELESRLAELESESRSWKSTNMALRSQLSLLEEELQHYRRPQPALGAAAAGSRHSPPGQAGQTGQPGSVRPAGSAGSPGLQGQYPQQGPGVPQLQQQMQQQLPMQQLPAHMTQPFESLGQPSPESISIPGLSFDSPGSGTSSVPSRADEFCEKLSTACGTRDRPVPESAPRIASEVPGWQTESLNGPALNGLGNPGEGLNGTPNEMNTAGWVNNAWPNNFLDQRAQGTTGLPTPESSRVSDKYSRTPTVDSEPLNLDFGNVASGFGRFSMDLGSNALSTDMNGLLNNDFGMFDPLDDMLVWDGPKGQPEGQAPSNEVTNGIAQGSNQVNPPPNLVASQDFGPEALIKQEPDADEVPAAPHKFIPCADVWDRICSHPRFGEIDINSMCQELRNKARCSKAGVVLDEQDVVAVLGSIR